MHELPQFPCAFQTTSEISGVCKVVSFSPDLVLIRSFNCNHPEWTSWDYLCARCLCGTGHNVVTHIVGIQDPLAQML